jgi:8-oxo-dGTP diphosphatase
MGELPFKISVLVFLKNPAGQFLLIQRRKAPNLGCWSPIGGKLEMAIGESPFECALRETEEETGLRLQTEDLHCFGCLSEKAYEGNGHWLMFLFDSRRPIDALPATIDEGHFGFFDRAAIEQLNLPQTDRTLLWPQYDHFRQGFIAFRADCDPAGELRMTVEQSTVRFNADERG